MEKDSESAILCKTYLKLSLNAEIGPPLQFALEEIGFIGVFAETKQVGGVGIVVEDIKVLDLAVGGHHIC